MCVCVLGKDKSPLPPAGYDPYRVTNNSLIQPETLSRPPPLRLHKFAKSHFELEPRPVADRVDAGEQGDLQGARREDRQRPQGSAGHSPGRCGCVGTGGMCGGGRAKVWGIPTKAPVREGRVCEVLVMLPNGALLPTVHVTRHCPPNPDGPSSRHLSGFPRPCLPRTDLNPPLPAPS